MAYCQRTTLERIRHEENIVYCFMNTENSFLIQLLCLGDGEQPIVLHLSQFLGF